MKQLKQYNIYNNQSGVAALLVVIIISAAVLVMAYSASVLGLGELEMGYTSQKGGEVFILTDGCAEEALYRLRLDSNYSGGALNLSQGSCIIDIVALGDDRIITVTGTVDDYNKKIEVGITLAGNVVTINSWQEI